MTGMLVDGEWRTVREFHNEKGVFDRKPTTFRRRVDAQGEFTPEEGRYHLYVSYACPWAHRTLIVRQLRKLDGVIGVSVVHPLMGDDGWTFAPGEGVVPDPYGNARYLREVYLRADPKFTGRITVPILWDSKKETIVNNESREIIRMMDRAFLDLGDPSVNLCPADLESTVDATIDAIYEPVNNGVYRTGFAGTQTAYDQAVDELFAALEHWDGVLAEQRYLCGDTLTEADICLFTTLARFDLVYHTHFKCNVKRIIDYPNLWGHTRENLSNPWRVRGHRLPSHHPPLLPQSRKREPEGDRAARTHAGVAFAPRPRESLALEGVKGLSAGRRPLRSHSHPFGRIAPRSNPIHI